MDSKDQAFRGWIEPTWDTWAWIERNRDTGGMERAHQGYRSMDRKTRHSGAWTEPTWDTGT